MKTRTSVLAVVVLAAGGFAATTVKADYSQTFDTSGSVDAGSHNFNPPPVGAVFDYGGFTPQLTAAVAYSPTVTSSFGSPNSGSVQLSWNFNAADGAESSAFTFDLFPGAQTFSTLSFDMMVGVGSTPDSFGGYGFFQVFTRDENYSFENTGYYQELANPGYGSPSSPGAGVWQHVSINLNADGATSVRAITFQDYADNQGTVGAITGPETLFIDDISLTSPAPEPATLTLLGLGAAGLLCLSRNRKA